MKKYLIGLVLALSYDFAYAATWIDLPGADGFNVQIDTNSIVPAGNGLIKAWVSHSFSEWQMSQTVYYKSALQLDIFDCTQRISGVAQEVFYLGEDRNGKVVRSASYLKKDWGMSDVVPGSVGESALDFACKWAKEHHKK